ncbi:MAG: sigma-54-dependent transcriptional regulator [Myxococcota bacterium]
MARILIVDDDENICQAFQLFLDELGHTPLVASNAADARRIVSESPPDLVLMDIRMPGTDGLEALPTLRAIDPDLYVVMMTAYGTAQTSIEAMRLGAFDYLTKPLDLDVVKQVIDKALEARAVSRKARSEDAGSWEKYSLVDLVGHSPRMQEVYKRIGVLAGRDAPALLVGERGVGKELVARTIHANSPRSAQPYFSVSCRSLPETLLEAELFGSSGGPAGSLGVARTPGKLESAQGGTVLLADIEALPRALQTRLLRVVTDKLLEPGGDLTSQPVDVRILAASERDLAEEVREGRFDEELYDALRVITIELPPLAERLEDVPELVDHFIRRCNAELDTAIKGADPRVLEKLAAHSWPGNVGELWNVVRRACLLARGDVVTPDDLGDGLDPEPHEGAEEAESALFAAVRGALLRSLRDRERGDDASAFHDIVGRVEKALVSEALAMTSGNQVKAAALLNLNRTTLRKKIQLYGL